ncbi:MAG: hypothetical protein ACXWV1_01960 [Chitinophagaceae bacterium]
MNISSKIRTKNKAGLAICVAIFMMLPLSSFTQAFFGVSSNPADNGAQGTATAVVIPPPAMVAGDLVVMYAHYRGTPITLSMLATGGQVWTTETAPAGGNNQTFAIFWCRFNGTWAANPSVTVGAGALGLSAIMYVYTPTNAANSWGIHSPALNTAPGAAAVNVTINGFSTTTPNTVSMGFWCSPDDVTWGGALSAGWSKAGLSAQYRNISGSDQSHTAAYNIRPTVGVVNNVTQTQSIAQFTRTSRISWYEVAPPANDLCSGAITLNSGACPGALMAGTLMGSSYTTIPTIGCGIADRNDVWYSFVAQTTNPTITLSAAPANARLQLFSGTCAALTSVACGNLSIVAAGLTIGDTYYIRVYTDPNFPGSSGTFNICITDPAPSNNLCGTPIILTSSTSCVNTPGNMFGSTLTATTISAPNCASAATYDIWYRFVAQTTNPTITLSNLGASFAGVAGLQLLSNNCGGTFTSFYCGTTAIAANFLVPGTTYFIRVYGTGALPTMATGFGFNICVQDPVITPSNDECASAVTLSVGTTCNILPGDMAGATASAVPLGGTCPGPNVYDVWYKFTSINTVATVTIGGLGANFVNPRIEMFSGTCGSLTSIFCGASPLAAAGLTAGTTYYIRVYSITPPPPTGNARFTICITSSAAPAVRFGNSYVNISKKTTGGVVEPGDTLEIRMTVNHTSGPMHRLR